MDVRDDLNYDYVILQALMGKEFILTYVVNDFFFTIMNFNVELDQMERLNNLYATLVVFRIICDLFNNKYPLFYLNF